MKTVGAHQKDEEPPVNTNIDNGEHQDDRPDDRNLNHVREDQSQVGATGWKDTDDIIQNMNIIGRTRSRTKAREHHRLNDGLVTMRGDIIFAAASEIISEDCHQ
jgi:hypothetical protein